MLTRQIVLKGNRQILFRWEEVEGQTQTAYYYPAPDADLAGVVEWLTSVPFVHPAKLVDGARPALSGDSYGPSAVYRLVVSKRQDGQYRVTRYDKNGNGDGVEIVGKEQLRGRINARLRQIEIETGFQPIN
ncbi:hypothetical protein ACAW74_25830 [Fibrella sp. WM1]|uniref:hypothetical protein n=1 Tax=Fibrella musci TaxID=3242485 RepID=UPI0035205319